MPSLPIPVLTIALQLASNVFMTFAWYGHLSYTSAPILTVILVNWYIALFERLCCRCRPTVWATAIFPRLY